MFPSKASRVLIHVIGWLLFFSLIVGFVASNRETEVQIDQLFGVGYLSFFFVYIFIFYFNSEVLIPHLYLKKQYLLYFLVAIIMLAAVYFFQPFEKIVSQHSADHNRLPPHQGRDGFRPPPFGRGGFPGAPRGRRFDIVSIVLFMMVWSLSTAIQVIKEWRKTQQRAMRAEADKAQAELSFLKAQINPHFLFNTLNNIYAQAISKSDRTADSIMKLSNIMRYLTDEAGKDFVSASEEVSCITDYIDLQRMRLNNKVDLQFQVDGEAEDKQIAPLVLMAFIENVFKYGVSTHENSTIIIKLKFEKNSIHFFCQNRIMGTGKNEGRTGIGITNTRQRLEFLYAGRHVLRIGTSDEIYTVQLTLYA